MVHRTRHLHFVSRHAAVLCFLVVAATLASCDSDGEGTEPGDCTDRADNDGDGLFDCDDEGCAGSPDCDRYTVAEFSQDVLEAMCNKMDECGWLDDLGWTLEECLEQGPSDTAGGDEECEDFSPVAAEACIEAIEESTCEDYAEGVGLDVCEQVCSND